MKLETEAAMRTLMQMLDGMVQRRVENGMRELDAVCSVATCLDLEMPELARLLVRCLALPTE